MKKDPSNECAVMLEWIPEGKGNDAQKQTWRRAMEKGTMHEQLEETAGQTSLDSPPRAGFERQLWAFPFLDVTSASVLALCMLTSLPGYVKASPSY